MRRRRVALLGLLAAGLLAAQAVLPAAAAPRLETGFRRGVGIHTMLNWARLDRGDPGRYAEAPFEGPAYALPEATLRNVRAAGFDFVRLTVDPGPFLQAEGAPREALDRLLVATVRRFLAAGLAVMVNFHDNSQVSRFESVNWLRSPEEPVFKAYLALVRRTAGLLAGLGSAGVAFEPINEPGYGYDGASTRRWQAMCEMLHAAVRAAAPDLLVVLTGAQGGNRHGLVALDPAPFRASRVRYSFHAYEPYPFTHQGVVSKQESARAWRYFSDLPYPPASVPLPMVLDQVRANVEADATLAPLERRRMVAEARAQAAAYVAAGFDRRGIARAFDEVLDWARRNGVRPDQIVLGEFGATRTYGRYRASDPLSYETWLRDMREAAEQRGFAWSFWALGGHGGMALVSEDGATTLDRTSLRALGLSAE
ncbi:Endoglucanase 3 [Methylobacterium crusticola]|uniref:Endoglucanase 3 n=1 Tax=Methylobacterium crusticola TaxID=1697972 RepID=A0ABQ4R8B5_9HYPH|nr:cellulase family glycosylhydrolase [Methylobacterium crusticola]GJD53627.1 Endoglucanase 3 [Methylobacterium crusticola]